MSDGVSLEGVSVIFFGDLQLRYVVSVGRSPAVDVGTYAFIEGIRTGIRRGVRYGYHGYGTDRQKDENEDDGRRGIIQAITT